MARLALFYVIRSSKASAWHLFIITTTTCKSSTQMWWPMSLEQISYTITSHPVTTTVFPFAPPISNHTHPLPLMPYHKFMLLTSTCHITNKMHKLTIYLPHHFVTFRSQLKADGVVTWHRLFMMMLMMISVSFCFFLLFHLCSVFVLSYHQWSCFRVAEC
jgi:hypothetical protein